MIDKTDTVLNQLKLNVLTREMYEEMYADNLLNENEIYVIQEAVAHNTLSNRNTGYQHTANTIVFDDLTSLQEKFDNGMLGGVAQSMGSSTTEVMSQNAVSAELNKIYAALTSLGWVP